MDLTTIATALFILISAISLDTALHPRDIVLQAYKPAKLTNMNVTDTMLSAVMKAEVEDIFLTKSVVSKPVIRMGNQKGIGVSLTDAFGMGSLATAVQDIIGYRPDQIELHLFDENNTLKVLISGYEGKRLGAFEQEIIQVKDERLVSLVRRATVTAMATIDPYMTALHLMRVNIKGRDFSRSREVISFAKGRLRALRINPDRSMLENLEGVIALFEEDAVGAEKIFKRAIGSDPNNQVAILNLGLTLLGLHKDAEAEVLLTGMLKDNPPQDPVLLTASYMILSASYLGLRQPLPADTTFSKALAISPENPLVLALGYEVKTQLGDADAAQRFRERSEKAETLPDDYSEIAVLYFNLAWQQGEPVLRSPADRVAAMAPDRIEKIAPTAPGTARLNEPAKPATETPATTK